MREDGMTERRKAEPNRTRDRDGATASGNELETRSWVVWGVGTDPDRAAEPERAERPGEPGNDLAWEIASQTDAEWAGSGNVETRWVRIVDAAESEVDELVFDDDTVGGYAPYLIARENESAPTRMRGVLRSDVVKRRKPGRFDAATPM
jgi:hypothetical protein